MKIQDERSTEPASPPSLSTSAGAPQPTVTTTTTTVTTVTSTTTPLHSPSKAPRALGAPTSALILPVSQYNTSPKPMQSHTTLIRTKRGFVNVRILRYPAYFIPMPTDLAAPTHNSNVQGYYTVTAGQECGIFYNWPDVEDRVKHVPSACQRKHGSWQAAYVYYTAEFDATRVVITPIVGSRFDPCENVVDEIADVLNSVTL